MTKRKELFIILVFLALIFITLNIFTWNKTVRLDSDYDSNLPQYDFLFAYLRTNHHLPLVNPYAGQGLSVMGDPLSEFLNPLFFVPLYFLGVENGLRLVFFSAALLAAFGMWCLLKSLSVSGLVRVWGSLLYGVSGALAGRIAAGHSEKVLSYTLIPFYLLLLLQNKSNLKNSLFLGVIASLIFFSGDLYGLWFFWLFLLFVQLYFLLSRKEKLGKQILYLILTVLFFAVFSTVKIYAILVNTLPIYSRYYAKINPFAGSLPIYHFFLPFVMPFQETFYDRPVIQKFFGFYNNWYEYYSFISLLPFIFLYKIKLIFTNYKTKILGLLVLVSAFYVSVKYFYSPFHWLFTFFPILSVFRVPQRIYEPLTAIVIALLSYLAYKWVVSETKLIMKKVIYFTLGVSLFWTVIIFIYTLLYKAYEAPRLKEQKLVSELKQLDPDRYFVVNFLCCNQRFLIQNKIHILNYYYGWKHKDTPTFLNRSENAFDINQIEFIRPKYIISPINSQYEFTTYGYKIILENDIGRVWISDNPNIFPNL